jgi:hypothetical protein
MKPKNMTTPSIRNSISRPLLQRGLPRTQQLPRTQAMWIIRGFLLVPLVAALAWLALSQTARAVDPPPDGGYPDANTAEGTDALFSLTSGFSNTAIGFDALYYNTAGSNNTANGESALQNNTIGSYNTATGSQALFSNTTGSNNTATGIDALLSNTFGSNNTATGYLALFNNTGNYNTANGVSALFSNSSGSHNMANVKMNNPAQQVVAITQ